MRGQNDLRILKKVVNKIQKVQLSLEQIGIDINRFFSAERGSQWNQDEP